jgi:hypothetical protein
MRKEGFAICIVTFSKRLEVFSDLVKCLRKQTDIPIYVAVNGDYHTEFDDDYRSEVLDICGSLPKIFPCFYLKFRGLSKIWNDCIVNSCSEHIFMMNDDIKIKDGLIDDLIKRVKEDPDPSFFKVNNTFSLFYLNKNFIDKAGYFNEYYLGVGWEDTEFIRRKYGEAVHGRANRNYETELYTNLSEDYREIEKLGASHHHKYHLFNKRMFEENGPSFGVNFRPYEKFYMENYSKFWNYKKDESRTKKVKLIIERWEDEKNNIKIEFIGHPNLDIFFIVTKSQEDGLEIIKEGNMPANMWYSFPLEMLYDGDDYVLVKYEGLPLVRIFLQGYPIYFNSIDKNQRIEMEYSIPIKIEKS